MRSSAATLGLLVALGVLLLVAAYLYLTAVVSVGTSVVVATHTAPPTAAPPPPPPPPRVLLRVVAVAEASLGAAKSAPASPWDAARWAASAGGCIESAARFLAWLVAVNASGPIYLGLASDGCPVVAWSWLAYWRGLLIPSVNASRLLGVRYWYEVNRTEWSLPAVPAAKPYLIAPVEAPSRSVAAHELLVILNSSLASGLKRRGLSVVYGEAASWLPGVVGYTPGSRWVLAWQACGWRQAPRSYRVYCLERALPDLREAERAVADDAYVLLTEQLALVVPAPKGARLVAPPYRVLVVAYDSRVEAATGRIVFHVAPYIYVAASTDLRSLEYRVAPNGSLKLTARFGAGILPDGVYLADSVATPTRVVPLPHEYWRLDSRTLTLTAEAPPGTATGTPILCLSYKTLCIVIVDPLRSPSGGYTAVYTK